MYELENNTINIAFNLRLCWLYPHQIVVVTYELDRFRDSSFSFLPAD